MRNRIIAIAGGKGGVGKSVITLGLGACIAQFGKSVTVVDLDLGASNLHTLLGHRKTLCGVGDFLQGEHEDFNELSVTTNVEGLRFVPGTGLIPGMANLKYRGKRRILSGLKKLRSDYVLLDLGAGTYINTLDFLIWADRGIIVTAPIPAAILNAYEFIKNAVYRRLFRELRSEPYIRSIAEQTKMPDNRYSIRTIKQLADCAKDISRGAAERIIDTCEGMRLSLILNLAEEKNGSQMTAKLCGIAEKFLSVKLQQMGEVPYDVEIERLIKKLRPLTDYTEKSAFRQSMKVMAKRTVYADFYGSQSGGEVEESEPTSSVEVRRKVESAAVRTHVKSVKTFAQLVNSNLLSEKTTANDHDFGHESRKGKPIKIASIKNSSKRTSKDGSA